eukprot:417772-Hanusia_phi.AAC.1
MVNSKALFLVKSGFNCGLSVLDLYTSLFEMLQSPGWNDTASSAIVFNNFETAAHVFMNLQSAMLWPGEKPLEIISNSSIYRVTKILANNLDGLSSSLRPMTGGF